MSTQANFDNEILTDGDRKYVVQTLATVLMTYIQKPTLDNCRNVAKSLLSAYPFLKDESVNCGDGGDDGEVCILFFGFMLLLLLSTAFMEVVCLLSDTKPQPWHQGGK